MLSEEQAAVVPGDHVFDQAIAFRPAGAGLLTGASHPAYANMVGPYGGIIAAIMLNAVLCQENLLGEPVSLTVNYAAPIADGDYTLQVRTVRTNRSTQHWAVELVQDHGVAVFATVLTAIRRDTWEASDVSFPQVPAADQVAPFPTQGRAPWAACYDMRFMSGGPDALNGDATVPEIRVWVRDQPPRPLDFPALAAICDAFFPMIYARKQKRVPIGTVSLTTYFHANAAELQQTGTRHVLGVARSHRYGKGFFDQSGLFWSPDGVLLASTHQVIYFKA